MKKLLALVATVAVAVARAACSKTEDAPAPAPAAPVAATEPAAAAAPAGPASAAAAAPTASAADLPQECTDYLDKVTACVGKQSGPAADALKANLAQTRASWAAMGTDKASLGQACKAASDAYAAQAAAAKC
jgi:hypothetical protein